MIALHKILIEFQVYRTMDPLQGLEDNHPVKVTTPENAIDDDVVDIRTIYPPWSPDTNDMCDINQMTNYKSMKDMR